MIELTRIYGLIFCPYITRLKQPLQKVVLFMLYSKLSAILLPYLVSSSLTYEKERDEKDKKGLLKENKIISFCCSLPIILFPIGLLVLVQILLPELGYSFVYVLHLSQGVS